MHVFRNCLFFVAVILSFLSFSTAAAVPRGALGAVNAQGSVKGWTFDADLPGQSLTVHYYIIRPNGLREFAGALPADLPRADINTAFKVTGDHGVEFNIPQSYRTGQAHTLHMYAIDPQGKNPRIGSRTFSLASGTGSADTGNTTNTGDSSATGTSNSGTSSNSDSSGSSSSAASSGATVNNHKPRGSFGAIGASGTIYGWAYDPDDPAAAIEAHYYVVTPAGAREPMAAVLADLPRADINRAFKIDGDHGVSFSIPAKYRTGQAHTLQMYAIDPAGGVHPQVASRSFTLSSSSVDDSAGEPPVAAASLDYAVAGVKTFEFSWADVSDASYYQLFENPDGQSGFSQVGGNIVEGVQSLKHTIPLYARLNAQYLLQSCNDSGCTSSETVTIADKLDEAIGTLGKGGNYNFSISGDGSTLALVRNDHVDVYINVNSSWQLQAQVDSRLSRWGWKFGHSLGSIISLSDNGNTLAIGAPSDDSASSVIAGDSTKEYSPGKGAVLVFFREQGAWQEQAYIRVTAHSSYSDFGSVVRLSADGDTLAVADSDGLAGVTFGTVHIFKRNSSDVWRKESEVNFDGAYPESGMVISGDGSTLAIMSSREWVSSGQYRQTINVYKFINRAIAGEWVQQGQLVTKTGEFGSGKYNDSSGASNVNISINGDGSVIAVGVISDDSGAIGINGNQYDHSSAMSGAVHVFSRINNDWGQQAYIKADNSAVGDRFGSSVSLSENGNVLAVGAIWEDSSSRGMSGKDLDDSGVNAGAVYLFSSESGVWSQSAYIKGPPQSHHVEDFGSWVSLNNDGSALAVYAGKASVTDDKYYFYLGNLEYKYDISKSGAFYFY